MANELNLYDTLFADSTDDDCALEMINHMFHHLDFNEMSKYFDISSYNNSLPRTGPEVLSIMHFNLRSLRANVDKMKAFLHSLKRHPDIIAVSEHWLTKSNKDSLFLNGYKAFHVVRSWGSRGGVSLFVRNNIDTELVSKFTYSDRNMEICTIHIKIGNQKFNIVAIYRSNSKHDKVNEFTDKIANILKDKQFHKSDNLLIGDFNINLLEHQTHPDTGNYLATIQSLNYIPTICRPTRFPEGNQRGNESLLDHIYVNFSLPCITGIFHYDITDHLPIFINILLPQKHDNMNYKIKFRIFNEANKALFTRGLCNLDWENLLSADVSVDQNFELFYNEFYNLYNRCFPVTSKLISNRRIKNPWITTGLLTSIKRKSTMYRDFKAGLIPELQYKSYKNRIDALTRKSKKEYYRNIFANYKNNTSKLWKTINNLTKPPHAKESCTNIIHEDKILTDAEDISNAFNKFFTTVATKLDSNLPPPHFDPLQYLQGNFPNVMQKPRISFNDIIREIKTLKNKNCSIEDFSPKIIKENSRLLAIPLAFILNQSLNDGNFPNRLKSARVIPIYKKGAKSDMNNFRPISILNIFSKIFEKVMKYYLVKFLCDNSILSPRQFGFQKGKSTEDALIEFSKKLYSEIDNSNNVLSIFIDFSKAFDTVPHDLLIKKWSTME